MAYIINSLRAAAFLALLAGLLASPGARAQKPRPIVVLDRIVAIVNEDVVTRHELEERVVLAFRQLKQQGTAPPPRDVLERQLLERMIVDKLQQQFARETGLRIDDVELDRTLTRIAEGNKMSLPELRQRIQQEGIPFEKFRNDIRGEIIATRLREREVDSKIVITESEIDNFIATQQAQEGRGDEYNLAHILVRVQENASPEQIQTRRERAEKALAAIRSGTDFRQVAASFSEAPDALQGGMMGWREGDRLPVIFVESLRSMKPGEVSSVLRSSNGFHILLLVERRGTQAPMIVQQTRARHILIKTNELVSEGEARNRLRTLKERLENKGDFAELARVHSEDTSASKGGDLGWLTPGDTVPEFERAMNALKPGEVSDPVRSPFGWHLIQVTERRSEDVSKERQRLTARQALRARKSDEAYDEWLRQLRDRAFVELRLEDR